jgi:hypothetical protein
VTTLQDWERDARRGNTAGRSVGGDRGGPVRRRRGEVDGDMARRAVQAWQAAGPQASDEKSLRRTLRRRWVVQSSLVDKVMWNHSLSVQVNNPACYPFDRIKDVPNTDQMFSQNRAQSTNVWFGAYWRCWCMRRALLAALGMLFQTAVDLAAAWGGFTWGLLDCICLPRAHGMQKPAEHILYVLLDHSCCVAVHAGWLMQPLLPQWACRLAAFLSIANSVPHHNALSFVATFIGSYYLAGAQWQMILCTYAWHLTASQEAVIAAVWSVSAMVQVCRRLVPAQSVAGAIFDTFTFISILFTAIRFQVSAVYVLMPCGSEEHRALASWLLLLRNQMLLPSVSICAGGLVGADADHQGQCGRVGPGPREQGEPGLHVVCNTWQRRRRVHAYGR